ncbi:MAG: TolC family protein, partial [Pirellulaceae bacterium]|nr:TolC family protein [Pirellulaceae bacterium]
MRRPVTTSRIFLICLLAALSGCSPTQPFFLHEDGDLSHYIDKATAASAPDLNLEPLPDVEHSETPLTLSNPEPREMWDLSLEEVVSISLANTKILRGGTAARLFNGQLSAGTQEGSLTLNSIGRTFASIYDPAIVSSNPGQSIGTQANPAPFGDGGVANVRSGPEAALAEFDTQLRMVGTGPNQSLLSSTDRPQNIPNNVPNVGFIRNIQTKTGGLSFEATKQTPDGTVFAFRNTNTRDSGFTRGSQFQALKSFWTATLEVEARHPLLRGRGVQINRMPVVLGRIGEDIEIMSLNANLQDTLNNIEIRYWDLYLAYRNLETAKLGRDGSLVLWRVQYERLDKGAGNAQEEAEAREQYFNFKSQITQALRNLYDNENELRLLMGLSPSDGRLIRPSDEPTMARVNFDWTDSIAEAIVRRPELISKHWTIKQRELELIWSRNFLLPQLDVGGLYRWVGLGDDLINADRNGINFPGEGSAAYDNLFGGE